MSIIIAGSGNVQQAIANPFLDYSNIGGVQAWLFVANTIAVFPFRLPYAQTFGTVLTLVQQGNSGTNKSDIGIYDIAGNLLLHIGAQTIPNTPGIFSSSVVGGPVTLSAGCYLFAVTGEDTNPLMESSGGVGGAGAFAIYDTNDASIGGALPSSIVVTQTSPISGTMLPSTWGYSGPPTPAGMPSFILL